MRSVRRALGAAVQVWNVDGRAGRRPGTPGEMVITEPMPSMPLRFWDDPDDQKLRDTYFATSPASGATGDLTC